MATTQAADKKELDVFISYSRKDIDFARKVVVALEARGLKPKIDTRDLPKLEDWRRELLGFIREADAAVFIVSPNSISSPVCAWEVEQIAALNKRLAPIVLERVPDGSVPEAIAKINYLFFDGTDDFDAQADELARALQTDMAWLKEHRRVGELARRWDESGRPSRLTLRGQELQGAEHWVASRPHGAPEPTDLHRSFVVESRRAATRRLRLTVAGSLAISAVAAGLAVFAFVQRQAAEVSRSNAVQTLATSDFRQGTAMLENRDTTSEAMALLSRSAREGRDRRALTRLWTLLQQRRFWLPVEAQGAPAAAVIQPQADAVPNAIKQRYKSVTVDGAPHEVNFISVSGDSKRIFTAIGSTSDGIDVQYRIWRSDGTPVTPWIKPTYNGDHYVAATRGYMSFDGNVLALEVMGWRETACLQIFDLKADRKIGPDIRATGQIPNNQNVGFSRVQFVQEPARGGADPFPLLFTVSDKGDAIAYRVDSDNIDSLAKSEHAAPIVFADLDKAHDWLMTSSADGIFRVVRLTDNGGEAVGNVLHFENAVTSASRVGDNQIVLTAGSDRARFFSLSSAVKMPLASQEVNQQPPAACMRWDDSVVYAMDVPDDRKLRLAGGELTRLGPRQLAVVSQGRQVAVSPIFANEVILACLDEAQDTLAVTTSDFVTEVWITDFSRRLGLPIVERRVFREGATPVSTKRVFVTRDKKSALIESSLWDPPNVDHQWYSLWDLETGQALMDRTHFANDISDNEVERAMMDPGTQNIIFVGENEKKFVALSSLSLALPEAAESWMPDLGEAIGGVAVNSQGAFEPVPDRQTKIRQGFDKIREVAPGFEVVSGARLQSSRSEAGPRPVASPQPAAHQTARAEANPQSAPVPTTPAYDPVGAVRAFYQALSRADGEAAQMFVVPEKRGLGPFNQANIRQFYSSLPQPMEIRSVELASKDAVNVEYRFVRPDNSECHGRATVDTTFSGGKTLIRRIAANC
ncbi:MULTISPECIES: toll/interleukin-1 receptor domain-containing protein [unclassified Bradyrhizobium]|uniref:toll/interleukin-1 receptor domain-containing protein n=1 Tax=unclassified Bradyrhizobium TaxID=2631580 RepID=UPI0028EFC330|nr:MULTISPECIES: toll/interleukin-1 receptor domain-containing protein [unclassified Bradyrhizobium]